MSRSSYDVKETYVGNGSLSAYSFSFKIEALAQLEIIEINASNVETQRVRGDDTTYLSSVTFDSVAGGGTVNLAANLTSGYSLVILLANDAPTQPFEFRNKTSFTLKQFENALDFIAGAIQRLAYKGKQAFRIHDLDDEETFDSQLPAGVATSQNKVIAVNSAGTGLEYGPTSSEISGAEASATAAAASASAASTSETNAATSASNASTSETNASASASAASSSATTAGASETNAIALAAAAATSASNASTSETNAATSASNASTSETNASNSATAAANAAAASIWSDAVFVTNSDSPVAIADADRGKLYVADTSGGAIVFNLPSIAGLDLSAPWSIGIKKDTGDSNAVTINRNGTDDFDDGSTSLTIAKGQSGYQLVPDTDPTPDAWASIRFGEPAINTDPVYQELSSTPSNPSSGFRKKYFKTDGKLYQLSSAGVETEVGSSGAGDSDTLHLITGDSVSSISDVDLTGNNSDFDGGGTITASSLTLSTTAADLLIASKVFKYVPGADGSDDYFGFTKAIKLGARKDGVDLGFVFNYKNDSAYVAGDVRFCVKQKDGTSAGDIDYIDIEGFNNSNNTGQRLSLSSYIEDDCTEIEFGFQNTSTRTALEFYFDNVKVTQNPFVSKSLLDEQTSHYDGIAGYSATDTAIPYYTNNRSKSGSGLYSESNDSTNGLKITAIRDCKITIDSGAYHTSQLHFAITKNSTELTTNVQSLINEEDRGPMSSSSAQTVTNSVTFNVSAGDIIRPHTNGVNPASQKDRWTIYVTAVAQTEHVVTPATSNLTNWTEYTPSTQGFGTISNVECFYRRVGSNMELSLNFTSGTVSASEARVDLPSGFSSAADFSLRKNVGTVLNGASSTSHGGAALVDASSTYLIFGDGITYGSGTATATNAALGNTYSSSSSIKIFASIPIAGWTSNVTFLAAVPLLEQPAYSSTEHTTGKTWSDGKVIYRRTFNTSYANGATVLTGVDKIIDCGGIFELSGTQHLFFPFDNAATACRLDLNPSTGTVTMAATSTYTVDIWVEYTKD